MPDNFGSPLAIYKDRYVENTRLQIQLMNNPYEGLYTPIADLQGEKLQVVDILGAMEPIFDVPDNADTPTETPKHLGIWVQPRKLMAPGIWVTDETKIKTGVDPTGKYVMAHAAAITKGRAAMIRDAIFGPRLLRTTNAAGGLPVATAFDLANRSVAVNYAYGGGGSASGMTVQKFIKAIELFGVTELDVDAENICCAMTQKQMTDLFQAIQVTSSDYVRRAQFEEKTVKSFMGVKIVVDPRLPVNPAVTTDRMIPFWSTNGIHYGEAMPFTGEVDKIPTRQNQILIQGRMWCGATRSEDERVAVVYCRES